MAASKPTAWLSQAADALCPFALGRHFGPLTAGWVDPLSQPKFTPELLTRPDLRCPHVWSLTASRGLSTPKPAIGRSTARTASPDVYLRVVSAGTSYCQSRLDFHPFTGLKPKICTSSRLRTSTPLSRGFILARQRSAGFGYSGRDSRRAHLRPRCLRRVAFASAPAMIALASPRPQNSLARYSKRIARRCSTASRPLRRFHAVRVCGHLVSGSLHLP